MMGKTYTAMLTTQAQSIEIRPFPLKTKIIIYVNIMKEQKRLIMINKKVGETLFSKSNYAIKDTNIYGVGLGQ